MKFNRHFILLIFILTTNFTFPQEIEITKFEPPNWWAGMKLNKLQLMLYGNNLNDVNVRSADSAPNGIKIIEVHKTNNSDYLFVDLEIKNDAPPGSYKFIFEKNDETFEFNYSILKREADKNNHQGFDAGDIIYLITPDRFANGDTSNDRVEGMMDEYDPNNPTGRHGGDIKGIINKLDYLKDLGVTALWINPLMENNGKTSYHGFAATNFYKIDPRFGTNELYKELAAEAHAQDLKIIMDHVSNHIGINHPWIKNLPTKNWLNGTVEDHELTDHYKIALSDIYGDKTSSDNTFNGWFTNYMPDLNQTNPYVKNYLIQNSIWWIEYTGLDGIREDTYPYADQKFLAEWAEAILQEYPDFNIVGEVWVDDPVFLADYQTGSFFPKEFDTNLPSVTDFGMFFTYYRFLTGEGSLYNIYENISKDFIYPDPQNLVTFLDNHDVERAVFYSTDIERYKLALSLLLTTRGIPQLYYGTEIGMKGGKEHGTIREDFPGGFPGDDRNAFAEEGMTAEERDIFNFTRSLLHLRKKHSALSHGKLLHYPPSDEIYLYLKIHDDEKILAVINGNEEDKKVSLNKAEHLLINTKHLRNIITGEEINYSEGLQINSGGMTASFYQLIE